MTRKKTYKSSNTAFTFAVVCCAIASGVQSNLSQTPHHFHQIGRFIAFSTIGHEPNRGIGFKAMCCMGISAKKVSMFPFQMLLPVPYPKAYCTYGPMGIFYCACKAVHLEIGAFVAPGLEKLSKPPYNELLYKFIGLCPSYYVKCVLLLGQKDASQYKSIYFTNAIERASCNCSLTWANSSL